MRGEGDEPPISDACSGIEVLRKKIDKIDNRILKLIEERVEIAKEIGRLKKRAGLSLHDRKREAEILKRIEKKSKYPVAKIWKEIMRLCLCEQQK
jgi:monofunctional chorismate mutase